MLLLVALSLVDQTQDLRAQTGSDQAREAADLWLVRADARDGGGSWDAAGAFFRTVISRERWQTSLISVREPLGGFASRMVRRVVPTRVPPGAPDGSYIVVEYDSQFERKGGVFEAVTMVMEPDGFWRVVGYFIR